MYISNIFLLNKDGSKPIHKAAELGCDKLICQLYMSGIDINTRSHDGRTPLDCACKKGYLGTAKTLLILGADPSIKDSTGKQPIDYIQSCSERSELERHSADISITDILLMD